jgi:hypothetical protein
MIRTSGARGRYGRGYPVTGIIWSPEEFMALPWVRDYLPAGGLPGSGQDPRGQICGRDGEKIPAELAVLDMAADDTAVIAVANARATYLEPGHPHVLTGTGTPGRHCISWAAREFCRSSATAWSCLPASSSNR